MSKSIVMMLAAMLAATPAFAQSETAAAFTGPYVGGQIGWAERSATLDLGIAGADPFKDKRSSVEGGVFAGYATSLGSALIGGIEADIGIGGRTLSDTPAKDVSASIDPKFNAALTGRLGVVASDRVLVYGLAGYGGDRVKIDITQGSTATSTRQWSDGVVYGGGLSVAVAPNVAARAEYRHLAVDGGYSPDRLLFGASIHF